MNDVARAAGSAAEAPSGSPTSDVGATDQEAWTRDDAKELYLIDRWGGGYFDVNEQGKMTIAPLQERGRKIAIRDVVAAAAEQGLRTPLLVRFQDLLHHR